jgi:hypothetical protein
MTLSKKHQSVLKTILIFQTLALLVYTSFAVKSEGWTLFQVLINNITALKWNGQFNLDFSCYLLLSGIWIVWRNKFSGSSFIIASIAMIIGIIAFAPYLLYLIIKENGDLKKVLLGKQLN